MKKLIAALLALSLLLSCASGLAESAPMVFEETGINVDFKDVMEASPYYLDLVEYGILDRDPFIAFLYLEYYALDKDVLFGLLERFDGFSEEAQDNIRQTFANVSTIMAYVFVTDAQDPDAAVRALFGEFPEGAEVTAFGEVEAYHYLVVMMPEKEMPDVYDDLAGFGIDPATARKTPEELQADMDGVRSAFIERLRSAELYAPVDPEAGLIGQVLRFETTDLDGNTVTSDDLFRDNRITMVNLWGMWCGNCVVEMAELAEIHARLREKGCGIVGVEWEGAPIETMVDEIRAFLEEKGVDYPNVIMPGDNEILNQVSGYPTSFFVDSTGRILTFPIVGARIDRYERTVERLLNGGEADTATDAGAVKNDSGIYRVIVCDVEGNPVEGAVIQFCDDVTCAFQPTDAEGVAAFSVGEQKVYDVHVLTVPEGYAPDEGVYKTLDTFSDVNILLEKAA